MYKTEQNIPIYHENKYWSIPIPIWTQQTVHCTTRMHGPAWWLPVVGWKLWCYFPLQNQSSPMIEQGLTSPPTQYRLSGRQFYRSKDPTNSIKVLKEKLASHSTEEAQNPPGASHRVTSEPLKKRKTLSQWVGPSETKPHTAGRPVQVLFRAIDCATIDATQHFSKTGLEYCTLFAPSQHQWWNVAKVQTKCACVRVTA